MVSNYTRIDCLHFAINLAILALCVAPVGTYLSRVYQGKPTFLSPLLTWFENLLFKLAGVDSQTGMTWKTYALSTVTFSGLGFAVLYLILTFQGMMDSPAVVFNIAASFVSNTPMSDTLHGLSPVTRMLGLTVQNFLSAAVSLSVFVAVTRGLSRSTTGDIGNFWVDMVRSVFYVLLPLSLLYAVLIATAGVGDAIESYAVANLTHPFGHADNLGAIAISEAGRLTVTQAGGFVNATNARLADVSTPLTGFLDVLARWLIPAALCWTFGDMIKDKRQACILLCGTAALVGLSILATVNVGKYQGAFAGLADGNGAVLYGLVALLSITAGIRGWVLGGRTIYKDHLVGRFDFTMASTVLLIPLIVLGTFYIVEFGTTSFARSSPMAEAVWGLGTLVSRFWMMIPALAIAGSFASSPRSVNGYAE